MSEAYSSGRFPGSRDCALRSRAVMHNPPSGCGGPNATPGTDQVSFGSNRGNGTALFRWVAVDNSPEAHNNTDNNTNNIELMRREYWTITSAHATATTNKSFFFILNGSFPILVDRFFKWCERGDSNPHGLPRRILSPVRLPNSATLALNSLKKYLCKHYILKRLSAQTYNHIFLHHTARQNFCKNKRSVYRSMFK